MSKVTPSLPKGTRDFGPAELRKRNYIFGIIKSVFEKYGFQPLETPAMENLSTLIGKYGEEGDKLLFRILDSGDFFESERQLILIGGDQEKIIQSLEKVLKQLFLAILSDLSTEANVHDKPTYKKLLRQKSKEILKLHLAEWIEKFKNDLKPIDYKAITKYFNDHSKLISTSNSVADFIIKNQVTEQNLEQNFENFKHKNVPKRASVINSPNFRLQTRTSKDISSQVSSKGLRYDLTIPFARYVVQHQHEITFPFKRYQIQPVWRADRPQKGRYREFYQCDADVIGSDSLLNEVELILIYDEVFRKLRLDVTIAINSRKIIEGIASAFGQRERLAKFISILDKIDKVGYKVVEAELVHENFISTDPNYPMSINTLSELYEGVKAKSSWNELFLSNFDELLRQLENLGGKLKRYGKSEVGIAGVSQIEKIVSLLKASERSGLKIEINPYLARGLDYYTGTIFEVKANGVQMGSIGGGGRYDNLTGVFGLPGVSGVGISFGVERIYDVMEELKLFDNIDLQSNTTRALFINFGGEAETKAFQYLQQLRENDIPAEIYPSSEKMKKQIGYADKKRIPYAIFVGEEELKNNTLQIKDLRTGEQTKRSIEETIELLK